MSFAGHLSIQSSMVFSTTEQSQNTIYLFTDLLLVHSIHLRGRENQLDIEHIKKTHMLIKAYDKKSVIIMQSTYSWFQVRNNKLPHI